MNYTATINIRQGIDMMTCYSCGVLFGVVSDLNAKNQRDGGTFYCPNGHSQMYSKTEAQRLKEQLDAANSAKSREWERANAEARRAELAEKKLRRVGKGVCPECKRSFVNLGRHLECNHWDREQ